MTRLRLLAVCGALMAPLLTSVPSLAQGPAQQAQIVDADVLKRSRELFEKGNKLFDQGKLQEAEKAYLEAWKLKKSYDVGGNLGDLELTLGKPRKAAEHLTFALREFPAGGKPAVRDQLVKRLGEAKAQVATLRIQVNRPGAEVLVDGESVGRTPLSEEVFVDPGQHVIEARFEDLPPGQQSITAAKGQQLDVSLVLVPKKKSVALLAAGGALTAVSAGLGVAMIVVSGSKASQADDLAATLKKAGGANACAGSSSADCTKLQDLNKSSDTFKTVAVVGFAAAGAFGIATLTYALLPSKGADKTGGLKFTPIAGPGTGGVVFGGSF